MDLLSAHLFLGIPITSDLSKMLDSLPQPLQNHFLNNPQSEFLQKVDHKGVQYIGKKIGHSIDFDHLYLAEAHIKSILKKLVPAFTYPTENFILFGFTDN